jgi:hypothetical protein
MTELIRTWILGVAGTAILTGLALSLTPRGRVHNVLRLICGTVMVLALISPVLRFDFAAYSLSLAQYREAAEGIAAGAAESTDRLSRTIIEEECAAYILDKAQVLGVTCSAVTVSVKWGDGGCWYPYEVYLEAQGQESAKNSLAGIMEAELGIPCERQHWSCI